MSQSNKRKPLAAAGHYFAEISMKNTSRRLLR
jgi:hypothetical protein